LGPKLLAAVAIGGLLFLIAWTEWDLWRLQTGQAESVRVWGPVAFAYDMLGIWAAASVLPGLLVLLVWSLRGQWVRAKAEVATNQSTET
jgi:hypothetical protein